MSETTGSRAPACVLSNLLDHRVLDAVDLPCGRHRVLVEHTTDVAGCPTSGTLSGCVHQRTHQRLHDVPIAGPAAGPEIILVRRRFACTEALCPRRTFVKVSEQVPLRARLSTRLRVAVLDAGRVVAEVAGSHGVSWWTVQRVVNSAADELTDPDEVPVRRLGVDEHRYRSVQFFRDREGRWRKYKPGGTSRLRGRMATFLDTDTGRVLGVVDGRHSAGVEAWLAARAGVA